MNTDELVKLKKLLDEGVISEEEFKKQKDMLLNTGKKKIQKNIGLAIAVIGVFMFCIGIISSNVDNNSKTVNETNQVEVVKKEEQKPAEFSNEMPISVSGKMYDNIIGVPELSLTITNTTSQNISAIKFYFLPVDVYGEEVNGIFTTRELYTDNTISAGATSTKSWQLLDSSIKGGDIFVYSVYFEDGTEWGNKNASISDIKKYGHKISVKY
ncbi:MAG: SHOCT domain-containing protein [Ruminococcaceae bacterium]|nr:SHOCT domain-containing protein [Oscillospiraceae bacterium]